MMKIRQIGLILSLLFLLQFQSPHSASASTTPSLTLISPGNGSRVTSPITISAQIRSQENCFLRITLADQSSSIIARQLFRLDAVGNSSLSFSTNLPFEIPRDSSGGLLSVEILDAYNRPVVLRSASITLTSRGEEQIKINNQDSDWLSISHPQSGEVLGDGEVRVEGTVRPVTGNPVFFELITDNGGEIGTRQLAVGSAGETLKFDITIPYAYINKIRDVLLVIRQRDNTFGKNINLDSVPISLSP